jgi:hypothetical protein
MDRATQIRALESRALSYEEAARASVDGALIELFRVKARGLREQVIKLNADPDYQLPAELVAELS